MTNERTSNGKNEFKLTQITVKKNYTQGLCRYNLIIFCAISADIVDLNNALKYGKKHRNLTFTQSSKAQ
ncbi:hypothetical protein QUA20_30470 [Microcoleus sp. Pol7_A1]|uniref:hypothetical protein n=1 Tax=Microcoleus sp. Pol7_A1 TaxID=2818893 RepID=UPI002FD4874E